MLISGDSLVALGKRVLLLGFAIVGLGVLPALAQNSSQIKGTIELHGCTARPTDFVLQSRRATAYDPQRGSPVLRAGSANARVQAVSRSVTQFTFVISGLIPNESYFLSLQFVGACGPMFWQQPEGGLVEAGDPPIAIHGYAARTRIEVFGEPGRGRPVSRWVGADALDFADPTTSVRKLRVQSDLTNLKRFVLQFATRPFPTTGRTAEQACMEDGPSVIRTLEYVIVPNTPPENDFHGRRIRIQDDGWFELPPVDFNALVYGSVPRSIGPDEAPALPIDPNQLKMLEAGAPLYVRAIPVSEDATGAPYRRCNQDEDGVPGWMMLAKLSEILNDFFNQPPPPPPPSLRLYSAKYVGPRYEEWPRPGDDLCVLAVEDHYLDPDKLTELVGGNIPIFFKSLDKWGERFIRAKDSGLWAKHTIDKNRGICWHSAKGGGGGFLGFFTDAVTGFTDALSSFVKEAGKLWDSIQTRVVSIAADVISAVPGVNCGEECKGLLATGVTIALASAGIPPKLPNLDTFKGDLREYLAAEIADQVAPGVPGAQALIEHSLEYAQAALEKYNANGGGSGASGLPDWLAPDLGLEPAVLTLTLERPHPVEPLPSHTKLGVFSNPVFTNAGVPVPRKFHNFIVPNFPHTLTIPIVLQPNLPPAQSPNEQLCHSLFGGKGAESALKGCLNDTAYLTAVWNKNRWVSTKLANNPCVAFNVARFQAPTVVVPIPPSLFVEVEAGPWNLIGPLGLLTTKTLTTSIYPPALPTPANQQYCTVQNPLIIK